MRPSAKHAAAPNGAVSESNSHSRVRANLIRVAAVLVGLAVAALLVIDGSRAAFSDQTHNGDNAVAAGGVEVTDDDADTAMFRRERPQRRPDRRAVHQRHVLRQPDG